LKLPGELAAQKNKTALNKIFPGAIVEYEEHGKPYLAFAQEEKNGKWYLLNENGDNLALANNRLYLFEQSAEENTSTNSSSSPSKNILSKLSNEIKNTSNSLNIENIWLKCEANKTYSVEELFLISEISDSPLNKISLRRALINDSLYFKRNKNDFSCKNKEEVERAKTVRSESLRLESEKLALRIAMQKIIMGNSKTILPEGIKHIEEIASGNKSSSSLKLYHDLIDEMARLANIKTNKHTSLDEKAFKLLCQIGHFTERQNLTPIRLGRPVNFSETERKQAEEIFQESKKKNYSNRNDFTHLEVFTIDSKTTSDFDDAISIEKTANGYIIGVHITDVSAQIAKNSLLEKTAFRRATSIYCPDETIPMLPNSLSEGVLSLKENMVRPALSFFLNVDFDYTIIERNINPSLITVKERLSYEQVDEIMCDDKEHRLKSELMILWDFSSFQETKRIENGSLQFSRRDLVPEITKSGKITLVPNNDETPARKLVSELMVIANQTAASFAKTKNIPFIYRTQDYPEGDIDKDASLIPEGPAREFFKRSCLKRSRTSLKEGEHAGLGLDAYCQITSPIRRALDLVLQRQLTGFILENKLSYSSEELEEILNTLTPGLDEANLIQRERNRFFLLLYISQEKLENFKGIIVRSEAPRPLAEIESIGTSMPFTPLEKLEEGKNYSRLLGKEVNLSIRKLDLYQNKLFLHEVK